ncbi:ZIP family metal transporter [Patescibacteria group bacterium]
MTLTSWVIIFSLIGGVFSLVGGVFLLKNDEWVKRNTLTIVSWAAGVLLTVAFMDLMPEAIEMGLESGKEVHDLFRYSLYAVVGFFVLERTFVWFHHHHEPDMDPPTNTLIVIGDSIHNLIDGIVIGTAFLVGIPTGIVTAIAVAAHEIPQEIADFGILLSSGIKKTKVFFINLISSFMTPVGALITIYFSNYIKDITPQLLAFAAGMFTYIACSDLIPELHHTQSKKVAAKQLIFFFLGIGITCILINYTHAG